MMSSFKMMSCGLLTSGMEKGSIFVLPTDDWLCEEKTDEAFCSIFSTPTPLTSIHIWILSLLSSKEQNIITYLTGKNHLPNILTFRNSIWALKYSKTLVLTLNFGGAIEATTNWTFAKARLLQILWLCSSSSIVVALSEITAYKSVIKKYTHLYTLGQKSWLPPSMQ